MSDQLLPPGRMTSGIIRRGDRIWRPAGPWTPAVHEYLRHLEAAGFGGAPRVLGIEGDFEVLTYLDGEVAADPHWQPGHEHQLPAYAKSTESLRASAVLLRQLHDAAAGFVPEVHSYRYHPHPPLPGEIICHGDVGPWNTVYSGGLPVAFIDFDGAGRLSRSPTWPRRPGHSCRWRRGPRTWRTGWPTSSPPTGSPIRP